MVTDFKKKQKRSLQGAVMIALGGLLVFCVCVFLGVADVRVYKKKQELDAQVKSLQGKISEIKEKNTKLAQGISESNNNQYIEKVAREELDMQKAGEQVVSFIQPASVTTPEMPAQKNVLQSWVSWVLGWFKK